MLKKIVRVTAEVSPYKIVTIELAVDAAQAKE